MRILILLSILVCGHLYGQSEMVGIFTLDQSNGKVRLNWTIKSGNTCNGIEIYRSTDSVNFVEIGNIQGVCGSSSSTVAYNFTDDSPIKNRHNHYKLKLGTNGFSKVLSIEIIDISLSDYLLRPNPVIDQSELIFKNENNSEYTIYVFDLSGTQVYQYTTISDRYIIDAADFIAGKYVFQIRSEKNANAVNGKMEIIH